MEEVYNIEILRLINFNEEQIKNIISENREYLKRDKREVLSLLRTFKEKGVNMNLVIEKYPYVLNIEPYEVTHFFELKLNEGLSKEEILDLIEEDPSILD